MARKYGKKASEKVERALHELKRGTLKSGSGGKVTSRKQAIAIGLSQARRAGGKVPAPRHSTMSVDERVRTYLSNMRPGNEIDGLGMARTLKIDPLEADYALERAKKAGFAVTSDGRWYGPARGTTRRMAGLAVRHATRKKAGIRSRRKKPQAIRAAGVRTYSDTGQTQAYIEWEDGSSTVGAPGNMHMQALLRRAAREGIRVRLGEVF